MAHVQQFARKPVVYFGYGKEAVFFAGKGPKIGSLITLDLPGLKSQGDTAVRDWLIEYHAERGRSGEHTELTDKLWRPAVLDDVLDTKNGENFVWHLTTAFSLEEFTAFAIKHGPALVDDLQPTFATGGPQRATALRKLEKRVGKIGSTLYAGTRRLPHEVNQIEVAADRKAVAKLGTFDADVWIDACAALKSTLVQAELLATIGEQLVESGADIGRALQRMVDAKLDKLYVPALFTTLGHRVPLAANLTDETIDMTSAHEVTVQPAWDVYKAKRVGPVKIGRAALLVVRNNALIYVRGERKLLHSIRSRGGTLNRWGCTLTVGVGKNTVQAKLLEVDRIDTLAQVDPKAAAKLAGESLPDAHPITAALVRAQSEPTWRRILADLLIERLVGIDADVARRLARTQARANRR